MQDIIDRPGQAQLTADEYADKYNISRRTVTRYINQGKLVAIKLKGRTHVTDTAPATTPIEPEPAKRLDNQDRESGQLARQPDDYLFRLGQLSVQAKAGHRWQLLAIVLFVLVFITAPAVVWLYMTWQDTAGELVITQAATTATTANLDDATATIDQLQAELVQAKTTAAELAATITAGDTIRQNQLQTIQDLREKLADERKRTDDQAELLARIQAAETKISQLQQSTTTEPATSDRQDAE